MNLSIELGPGSHRTDAQTNINECCTSELLNVVEERYSQYYEMLIKYVCEYLHYVECYYYFDTNFVLGLGIDKLF